MEIPQDVKVFQCIKPQSIGIGATVTGTVVDTAGYDEAMIILDVGTITATGTLDVKVQEAVVAAFSTPIDITGAAFPQVLPATDDAVFVGHVRLTAARKRYMRVSATDATAAALMGCSIVLMKGIVKPAQTMSFSK